MWRTWSFGERALSLFWLAFAAALVPVAFVDSSVHSVVGVLKLAGIFCILVSFALSPGFFFTPLSAQLPSPKPIVRGMLGFVIFFGVASALQLAQQIRNAF